MNGAFVASLIRGGLVEGPLADVEIEGGLDLIGLERADQILSLSRCRIRGAVDLAGASLRSVHLRDCQLAALLTDGADIGGDLLIEGCRIGPAADALSATGARVRQALRICGHGTTVSVVEGATCLAKGRFGRVCIDGTIEGALDLGRSVFEALELASGARLGSLAIGRAEAGNVHAAPGATVLGRCDLRGISISGDLDLGGRHEVTRGPALELSSGRIGGDLHLRDGFSASGPIEIAGLTVAGDVRLGGILRGGPHALDARLLECGRLELTFASVEGGLSFRQTRCSGLVVAGHYRMPAGQPLHLGIECSGRTAIGAPGRPFVLEGTLSLIGHRCRELVLRTATIAALSDGPWRGVAIAARHLDIATLARFGHPADEGVTIRGTVALDHASGGDDLRFANIRIDAPAASGIHEGVGPPPALTMRKLTTAGSVLFEAGARLAGGVDLSGLAAEEDLSFAGLSLASQEQGLLDLRGSRIRGTLSLGRIAWQGAWTVDLRGAEAAAMDDAHGRAWGAGAAGPPPCLKLSGFRYAQLADLVEGSGAVSDESVDLRVRWIESHAPRGEGAGFDAQPYHVFAQVLAGTGHGEAVKRVELAARVAERRAVRRPLWLRAGNLLLEYASGYGYSPGRALLALGVYLLIGWAGVELAAWAGVFEPSPFMDGSVLSAARRASPGECPWLKPPLYALELMVPLVTLGTENFCSVRADEPLWSAAQIVYRLFGWILVSLAILTFSGVLRRDR
ncbi:MAG TPA: hypothetical protein VF727_06540 [Allosphingosinicella sp.]